MASQDVKPRNMEKEDGPSQECKGLLPSLSRKSGWFDLTNLYQCQGFWTRSRGVQGVLNCQQHFQAQTSDLLLVTTPKSGTTWLKAISFAIVNRVRHPPTKDHHPLLTTNPHDLVPFLELLYADNQVPDLSSFSSPRLFSTHIPFLSLPESIKDTNCKVVYLCRNPKDTFISLWHFTNKLRPKDIGPLALEEAFEKFCNGVSLDGPFWDHVLGYWKQSLESPQRVLFLRFEDMKEEPATHVRRLAEFLGHPFSMEEEREGVVDEVLKLCSFDKLSNLDVNKNGQISYGVESRAFFRRGEVGDWVNYLTPKMAGRLDQITEQKFHGSGLKI